MNTNITALIFTLNEEKNLPYALESCSFADELIVFDFGAKDRTKRIAIEKNAHFVNHEWEGYAHQKNWGLNKLPIRTDWVFILDADESIMPSLSEELIAVGTERRESRA